MAFNWLNFYYKLLTGQRSKWIGVFRQFRSKLPKSSDVQGKCCRKTKCLVLIIVPARPIPFHETSFFHNYYGNITWYPFPITKTGLSETRTLVSRFLCQREFASSSRNIVWWVTSSVWKPRLEKQTKQQRGKEDFSWYCWLYRSEALAHPPNPIPPLQHSSRSIYL
jgi:hypothetical protein